MDRDHAVLLLAQPGELPAAGVEGHRVPGQRGLDDGPAGLRGAQRGEDACWSGPQVPWNVGVDDW